MNIQPEIKIASELKLVGIKMKISLSNNKTPDLWKTFMPRKKEILNSKGNNLYSLQNYNEPFQLENFNQEFDKWALIPVADFNKVPNGMETFILKSGLYAVFPYKGLSTDSTIFIYIFTEWLPTSEYVLDERPHFEILGEKYKNDSPDSEEEIWIPIRKK